MKYYFGSNDGMPVHETQRCDLACLSSAFDLCGVPMGRIGQLRVEAILLEFFESRSLKT